MWRIAFFITEFTVIFAVSGRGLFLHSGQQICSGNVQNALISHMESHVQPVYKPYITMCKGHRLCSTYRTTYKIAYRLIYRMVPQPVYECCPGWRRPHTHADSCTQAICSMPCQNGGECSRPNKCSCLPGWSGSYCQTDVDECDGGVHGCAQHCINTAGSYRCECQDGYRLSGDGKSCETVEKPLQDKANCSKGAATPDLMKEEIQELRNRVAVLEQKLQFALAPIHSLAPSALEDFRTDQTTLLQHSFQQLDRIDSLSDQISFLEERLENCPCRGKL